MPSLPLVTRTGLFDKKRGSKVHTVIPEVHVRPANSTVAGVVPRPSRSLRKPLSFSGDLVIPRDSLTQLRQQQVLKRHWSAIVRQQATQTGATGTLTLKRKRSASFGSASDIALRRPLKRMRTLEGSPLPWFYDVWEVRALLRRQDSDHSGPRPRRRRPSPMLPPPSCFEQAAPSRPDPASPNCKPQPSHSHRWRPSSVHQVPRSCFEQAAAESTASLHATNSPDRPHGPSKSRARRRRVGPRVPTSAFQQSAQGSPAAIVPGTKPRSSRSSRRKQAVRPPTSCFYMESADCPPFETEVPGRKAGPQPAARRPPTASNPLEDRQAAGGSQLKARHSILPAMAAESCDAATAGIARQPEVPTARDAAVMRNRIDPASEANDAKHDPLPSERFGFSFQPRTPVSGTSLPELLAASTWWMPQVGANHQGPADIRSADQAERLRSTQAGIDQEIDACFPELSTSPTLAFGSTTPESLELVSHFDGDVYLFKDNGSCSASAGAYPAGQFDGDAYLFKDASSTIPPTDDHPGTIQPEIVKPSSLFSFQPVHAVDAATVYSWPSCSVRAPGPIAQA